MLRCVKTIGIFMIAVSATMLQAQEQHDGDASPSSAPIVRTGLTLRLEILASGEPEVASCTKRVSDTGTISLPLVGDVKVAGMTLEQLQKDLTDRYLKFLKEPQVMLAFELDNTADGISPFGHVTVLGRVKKPGWIKIPATRDLTVSRAVQQAGGLDTSAKDTSIKITRRGVDDEFEQILINLKAVGTKGDARGDIQLQPGDVVYVPEQIW